MRQIEALIGVVFGAAVALAIVFAAGPDQPVEHDETCIPIYESGLECCI